MRKLNYLWCLLFLCFACEEGGDDPTPDPDEETLVEQRLALLESTTWVPGEITVDGNDLLELYPSYQDFTLGFGGVILNSDKTNVSNGQYVAEGDKYGIIDRGPWMFKEGDEANTLIMMNGIEVNYTVSENSLRLEFTRTPPPISRTQAISGDYVFDLVPRN